VIGVVGAANARSIIGTNSSSMESCDIVACSGVGYAGRFADARDTGWGGYLVDFTLTLESSCQVVGLAVCTTSVPEEVIRHDRKAPG